MKLQGETLKVSNIITLVIPKGDQKFVFKFGPCDYTGFTDLCPLPEPKEKIKPGVGKIKDTTSPEYIKSLEVWNERRIQYMIIKSLEHTPDLELETVDMSDATTWGNYTQEFLDAGFMDAEIARIINSAAQANGLNNELIDKATADFLASERQKAETPQED